MNTAPFSIMEVVFIVTVLVVGYLILYRRLADMVQPIRLEIAEMGERLLASSISDRRKAQIRFYLDNAFNGLVMPVAALVFPFCFIVTLVEIVTKREPQVVHFGAEEIKVTVLFMISAAAANPIFAVLVALELMLFTPILFLASGPSAVASTLTATLKAERNLHFVRAAA